MMLLGPGRKKIVSAIVGSMKKPQGSSEAPAAGEEELSDPKHIAAKALVKALDSKDPARIAAAFSEMSSLCAGNEEYYGEKSSDDYEV